MADPFADLIPGSAPAKAAPSGPFSDLIPKKKVGRSEGVAQAFGSGALFNFGDEATAAVRAAFPKLADWMMSGPALQRDESIGGSPTPQTVSTAPTFQGRYDEELARERDKAKSFQKTNPVLATGANVAGGVANAAVTLPALAALPIGLVSRSVSPIANVLKSALTGAAYGGVSGYGAGEGDGRGKNALIDAGIGAAIGGATPPILAAGKRLMETAPGRFVSDRIVTPAINALSPGAPAARSLSAAAADGGNLPPSMAPGDAAGTAAQRAAIDRIATDMQRSGRSPESFLRLVDRYGPEAVLADLDPQFLRTATGVKVLPGETRTQAENILVSRDKDAGRRVVQAFEGTEPPPSTFALRGDDQAFDQNLRAVGQRVYSDMEKAGLKQSPELMAIYENPSVSAAIDRVMATEKATRIGTDRAPASPVEIMHKVKQAIWDLGFNKDTARPGPEASWYRDLGVQYMDRLKAANPKLAEADAAYSQAAKLPEFFDAGRNFLAGGQGEKGMNSSAPALADMLGGATPQQVLAARAGSTNAAREVTGGRNALSQTRALTRDIEMSPMIRDKLVELYGPTRAMEIMQRAETENVFANTSNRLLRGSQTAEKLSDASDVAGSIPVPTGASPTNLLAYGQAFMEWARQPNEAIRNEIGRALINPNTAENRRILQMAAEIVARRRGNGPIRAGLSEGSSNVTRD